MSQDPFGGSRTLPCGCLVSPLSDDPDDYETDYLCPQHLDAAHDPEGTGPARTPEGDEVAVPDDAALGIAGGDFPFCSVCLCWPSHNIPAHVAAVKAEVQEGIADGTFPVTIRTFSELHDYTDANMLRGLGDSIFDMDEDDEDAQQALSDTFNAITDEVSAWLATGRTDAPLTPIRRLCALMQYVENHSDAVAVPMDIPRPNAISIQTFDADVVVDATPDGWLLDALPALLPNGRPIAPADIYLIGWAVLDRLGVEYQR